MRLMTFDQWFKLLQSVFEYFLLFLTRIKVQQLPLTSLFIKTLYLLILCTLEPSGSGVSHLLLSAFLLAANKMYKSLVVFNLCVCVCVF